MTRRRFRMSAAALVAVLVAALAPAAALGVGPELPVGDPTLGPAAGEQAAVDMAAGPNGHFVVWEDARAQDGGTDLYGSLISSTGEVLHPAGIPIAVAPNSQAGPAVAWDGTNYVVVWEDDREALYEMDVYAARISPQGVLLDPDPIVVADDEHATEWSADIASDDNAGTLIVWQGPWAGDHDGGIRAATITDGVVSEPFTVVGRTAEQRAPQVAASTTGFLVAWVDGLVLDGDQSDIFGRRINPDGTVLDTQDIAIGTSPQVDDDIAVASDGSVFLVSWTTRQTDSFDADVTVAVVGANGSVSQPAQPLLAATDADETGSSVTFNGAMFLATWVTVHNEGRAVSSSGIRLYANGTTVDDQPTPLTAPQPGAFATTSSSRGDGWLVGLSLRGDVRALDVGADGVKAPGAPLLVSRSAVAQLEPAVALGGGGSLVAWKAWNGRDWDIHATRVTPGGTALDPQGLLVAGGPADQTEPDVAWNGRTYQVVWTQRSGQAHDIYGARVTPDGGVHPASLLSPDKGLQYRPALVWGGSKYLVVWEEVRRAPADVGGALVMGGEPARQLEISTALGDQGAPDVATDGDNFVVVFEDSRTEEFEITAARVARNGTILDPEGVAVTDAERNQVLPSVAYNGRRFVIAWSDNRPADFSYDVYAARFSPRGRVLDPRGVPIARGPDWTRNPVVVRRNKGVFFAWEDAGDRSNLGGRQWSRGGQLQPRVVLAQRGPDEVLPALAGNARRSMLAYQRFATAPDVRSVRVFVRRL